MRVFRVGWGLVVVERRLVMLEEYMGKSRGDVYLG
jgi:hypothetical protein